MMTQKQSKHSLWLYTSLLIGTVWLCYGTIIAFAQTPTPTLGSIGNNVSHADTGVGMSNVVVNLLDENGDVVMTAMTDANGDYLFDDLPLGTYTVDVNEASITDKEPIAILSGDASVTLTEDDPHNSDQDFTYPPIEETLGSIGDTIINADSGAPLSNVVVRLYDGSATLIGTNATDAMGNYLFTNLPLGDYRVEVDATTLPDTKEQTPASSPDGDNDSIVTLTEEAPNDMDQDYAYSSVPDDILGSIGDMVINAETAAPLGNVVVQLFSSGSVIDTVVTDASGMYMFAGLPLGDYTVQVLPSSIPAGKDTTGLTPPIDISLTEDAPNYDTADFEVPSIPVLSSIIGTLTHPDGTPVAGATVELLDDTGAVIATTTINATGDYSFRDLPLGDYTAQIDPATLPAEKVESELSSPISFSLDSEQPGIGDFEVPLPVLGSVHGVIVHDQDHVPNNADDQPLAGVVIQLLDVNGDVVETTVTGADGSYSFLDLPLGTYTTDVIESSMPDDKLTEESTFPLFGSITLTADNPISTDNDYGYASASSSSNDGIIDQYEDNDLCENGRTILAEGVAQQHIFHDVGDEDWVSFAVEEDAMYQVSVEIPLDSRADVVAEIYVGCDRVNYEVEQSYAYAPGVRLTFEAHATGTYYLRLYNQDGSVFGEDVTYTLSVTQLEESADVGAVVIVGGKERNLDPLQDNIHNVTDQVYEMFLDRDYPPSRIHYLTTDLSLTPPNGFPAGEPYVDMTATKANLENVITNLVSSQVDADHALTIYLMSHGEAQGFYMDGTTDQILYANELNAWLNTLESNNPGLNVNIIIDACYAGSFIGTGSAISKEGRVVIASASAQELAWASDEGANFSDFFLTGVRQGLNLYAAFQRAEAAVTASRPVQHPWIDDNGNGIPNQATDGDIASERGFRVEGSFGAEWEPYISEVDNVTAVGGMATLRARVLDDQDAIESVWAMLYPESYIEPTGGVRLAEIDLPKIQLQPTSGGFYEGIGVMSEVGEYNIAIFAQDTGGLQARPVQLTFDNPTPAPTSVIVQERMATGSDGMTLLPILLLILATVVMVSYQCNQNRCKF